MRIALVIFSADPARGGAERYTADLAAALILRGHEVAIVAGSFGTEPTSGRAVVLNTAGPTRLRKYRRFLAALDKHLKSGQYDIVHAMLPVKRCQFYHPHAGLAAEALESGHLKYDGKLTRFTALLGNRLNRKRREFAEIERNLLTPSDPKVALPVVLCLSHYVENAVRKHFALPDDRLARLFNGVDLEKFNPAIPPAVDIRQQYNLPPGSVVALMIAQDFARKGLRQAIEAISKIENERLVLIVVGRDAIRPYAAMAKKLNISQRVIFAGPTRDALSFYAAADFLVLPTRHDPCSLVVLEALAMGVPVITTSQNGASEAMTDGLHGFVLPEAEDFEQLAAAIRLLSNPERRRSMAHACLQLRESLSQDRHVDRLLELYQCELC